MQIKPLLLMGFAGLSAICLPVSSSWGWIDTGHKVVALIAWEDLTPKTKAAVTELLKQHPRYEKDLQADAEEGATPDEIARHAFAVAATWPDKVRMQEHPMHAEYNHPAWHFIDIPYTVGNATTQPESTKQQPAGPHNIVEAMNQAETELKDTSAPASKRSIDLCWIEHLAGDIHQPLHTASLISSRFPKGDQGGNSELVLKEAPYPDSRANLHFLWDSLPGDFRSEELDQFEANGLRADPKLSRGQMKDLLAVTDFMGWAKESHQLAVDDAYLNGKLMTAESRRGRGGGGTNDPIPGVPSDYMLKSEKVAMHQVTLAGYRLADLLNSTFDAQPAAK